MPRINDNFLKLQAGYLFPEIARRVNTFATQNPDSHIIKLGIGDVTEPLPEAVIVAMHKAVDEMGHRESFRGYGPEQGYSWLREAIAGHEYVRRGAKIDPEEIFVSDGSKCDTGNILDVLGPGNTVAVMDPVYPVYVDTNVMAGNAGMAKDTGEFDGLVYLPVMAENGFMPALPSTTVDLIYLCYPNNPTGAVATREGLRQWVDYARQTETLILFDAAYEAYINDPDLPHSIYEIQGAAEVAIEFRSFSKTAGFTGVRCAWTVVPRSVLAQASDGSKIPLHDLWDRRQSTKFNSVSYISQRGAEAVYSDDGRQQVGALVGFYLENARIIRKALTEMGLQVYGGVHAPYVWIKVPGPTQVGSSWEFFEKLLYEAHVVGTPGSGFGASGEGYFRLSAFNSRELVQEAMDRISSKLAV